MTDRGLYIRAAEIVGEVLQHPRSDHDTRAVELCGDDEALLEEVRDLLRMQTLTPGDDLFADEVIESERLQRDEVFGLWQSSPESGIPSHIGRFQVIREIGRGGMGVVYECEQPSPKRRVALKVVDALRYSKSLDARLAAEAQLQGRLQHPGIAQVFDAGSADVAGSRRPYFVMELVRGATLRMYVHQQSLSIRDRLALVALVADAIAHAHEHQIVHRDLKHENILITQTGQPKVLDFGIARFTGEASIGAMTITNEGQVLGTIGYMAPEQLNGQPGSVGPQADVYALGVILYELIAGVQPHSLAGLSIGAAVRVLDQQNPERLRSRHAWVSRDIDTVVGKCLEREPERRYKHAGELASELRRVIENQPIQARPPTRVYRCKMFAKRNKALVGGTAATVITLAIGVVTAALLGIGQHRARLEAEHERQLARMNEMDAIRGVLAGSAALADAGDIWESVRQLQAISPSSRGWEWHHTALHLPWLIQRYDALPPADRRHDTHFGAWVSGHEALYVVRSADNMPLVLDMLTSSWKRVDTMTKLLAGPMVTGHAPPRAAGVVDRAGNVGWLNVDTGSFEPTGIKLTPDSISEQFATAGGIVTIDDAPTVVSKFRKNCRIWGRGFETLTLGDNIPDAPHAGPWWEIPQPPIDAPYTAVANWGFPDLDATIHCVDRSTGEIVSTTPASHGIPAMAIDADGRTLYTRSPTGFDILSLPSLDRIGTIDAKGSALNLIASPTGGIAFVPYQAGMLSIYAKDGSMRVWPEPIGNEAFEQPPKYAPDGRLLIAMAPGDNMPWIIDTGSPIDPEMRGITELEAHASWVYQIAVSPDGSLLATGAPLGDIIIWELHTGRVLHRIDRNLIDSIGFKALRMDAPLVFSNDGETMYYGGFDRETGMPRLLELDLRTGGQVFTNCTDRTDRSRMLARRLGNPPRALYSHAATLPDGRVIEATSARAYNQRVAVFDLDMPQETEIASAPAEITAGVAVSPDGKRFFSADSSRVYIRDSATLEITHNLPDLIAQTVYGAAFSPDGSRLAIGTRAGQVLIYETEYYKRLAVISVPRSASDTWAAEDPQNRRYIYSVAWTPDGKRLVCAGGTVIRVLESERPFVRDHRAQAWLAQLESARFGEPSSDAAERVAAIERWANGGVIGPSASMHPPAIQD